MKIWSSCNVNDNGGSHSCAQEFLPAAMDAEGQVDVEVPHTSVPSAGTHRRQFRSVIFPIRSHGILCLPGER